MHSRNIELLIVMASCVAITLMVCNEFGPDELMKSGMMIALAGGPVAIYRLWQGRQDKE